MPEVLPLQQLEPAPKRGPRRPAPPPRFAAATLQSYRPQHPSQERAREAVRELVASAGRRGGRWPWQRPAAGRGLYLDGGFGVGKTHLLAAAYHAYAGEEKAYLSFQELVYAIGAWGMEESVRRLGGLDLLCLDEFELDDPGNTLIVKRFLEELFRGGGTVVTTSNTPPLAQGQGRFNADDFRREIQAVARRFETVAIEGADYRRQEGSAGLVGEVELERLIRSGAGAEPRVSGTLGELLELLGSVHPVRYHGLVERIGTLFLRRLATIEDQNDALRLVHFVDMLYDRGAALRAAGGIPLEDLFDASYRQGAFQKKYGRCLSRIGQLLGEPLPVADEAGVGSGP